MRSNVPAVMTGLRGYAPGDEAAIQELFTRVFGRARSDAAWRWRHLDGPGGPSLIRVFEDEGRVVGHISAIRLRTFAAGGPPVMVGLTGDLMVEPQHRGLGIMGQLVGALDSAVHELDMRLAFPTDDSGRLSERYGKGRLMGRLPRWVRPVTPSAAARRATGWAKAPAYAAATFLSAAARVPGRVDVLPAVAVTDEYDRLAEASATFARFVRVRDAAYIRWRWTEWPGRTSLLLEARRDGALTGWAVIALDEEDPSLGRVLDVLAADAGSLRGLLVGSTKHLADQGADRVVLDIADPRRWVTRACMAAGFARFGATLNVYAKPLSDRVGDEVKVLSNWYLTRGDTDLD